eukprot:TRINITY_DN1748_c0_g1_i5.p1 TRINITY_DN1748_c0_g1~~TRINITY_DN1748_c0_g1_i5.p1  ORF type:complete len:118 (-),score=19.74 TRINITY_DN1748_c0_g1_i5:411-725(-)
MSLSYEQILAKQWENIDKNSVVYKCLIESHLAPLLVDASEDLLKELEREAQQLASNDPSQKPRRPINPLHFLASYLMRNHPKYKSKRPASAYRKAVQSEVISKN